MSIPFESALLGILVAIASVPVIGCKACRDDEAEDEEEQQQRDNIWRAQISIQGMGRARTRVPGFDCTSDGATQTGDCGPKLLKFKELKPPTIEGLPAPGWRLDHWESQIREPDGSVGPRKGPMPDGRIGSGSPPERSADRSVSGRFCGGCTAGLMTPMPEVGSGQDLYV